MNMEDVYRAEAEALRCYYKQTKTAIIELEKTLEKLKGNLSEREKEALEFLLDKSK